MGRESFMPSSLLPTHNKHSDIGWFSYARSARMGSKDMIKIDSPMELDLDILGYIDPNITVNVIRDGKRVEKKHLAPPQKLVNIIRCKNPRCRKIRLCLCQTLWCQNIAVLQTKVLLLVEKTLLLDPCHIKNIIHTVSCYADIIAMRHPKEGAAYAASQFSEVPIINTFLGI